MISRDLRNEALRCIGSTQVSLLKIHCDISDFALVLNRTYNEIVDPVKTDVVHDKKESNLIDQISQCHPLDLFHDHTADEVTEDGEYLHECRDGKIPFRDVGLFEPAVRQNNQSGNKEQSYHHIEA